MISSQVPGAGVAGGAAVRADGAVRRRLRRQPAPALRRPALEYRVPVECTNVLIYTVYIAQV